MRAPTNTACAGWLVVPARSSSRALTGARPVLPAIMSRPRSPADVQVQSAHRGPDPPGVPDPGVRDDGPAHPAAGHGADVELQHAVGTRCGGRGEVTPQPRPLRGLHRDVLARPVGQRLVGLHGDDGEVPSDAPVFDHPGPPGRGPTSAAAAVCMASPTMPVGLGPRLAPPRASTGPRRTPPAPSATRPGPLRSARRGHRTCGGPVRAARGTAPARRSGRPSAPRARSRAAVGCAGPPC